MKISESMVDLRASTSYMMHETHKESLKIWMDKPNESLNEVYVEPTVEVENEEEFIKISDEDELKIKLLEKFVYMLTGKKVKFRIPRLKIKSNDSNLGQTKKDENRPVRTGFGMIYHKEDHFLEKENMKFKARGQVLTEDGREINFNVKLNLSRSFEAHSILDIKAGDALIDPLIINMENISTSLEGKTFEFDLDLDGKEDKVHFTSAGSGFLAYDKNGNGLIDDGSELFGPTTGNGFEELKEYDKDGNNWIDENDEIFKDLRIWSLNENGDKELLSLYKANVGAIYLGHVNSDYSLKELDQTLGKIRETGVYLKETGDVGTIQHVDLNI